MPRGATGQVEEFLLQSVWGAKLNKTVLVLSIADGELRHGEIKWHALSGTKAGIEIDLQTCPASTTATTLLILH